jgi:hypothetical protein
MGLLFDIESGVDAGELAERLLRIVQLRLYGDETFLNELAFAAS